MNPQIETESEIVAQNEEPREWCIVSDWDESIAVFGGSLNRRETAVPAEEVPNEITCAKCISVEKSVFYRAVKSPVMRCKVWLVG